MDQIKKRNMSNLESDWLYSNIKKNGYILNGEKRNKSTKP